MFGSTSFRLTRTALLALALITASCSTPSPQSANSSARADASVEPGVDGSARVDKPTAATRIAELERQLLFWQRRFQANPADFIASGKAAGLQMQLARVTGEHQYYRDAERILRQSARQTPSVEVLTNLAFALNAQHRFADAREIAEQVVTLDPSALAAWAALGDAQLELGNGAAARRAYQRLIDADEGLFAFSRWANLLRAEGNEAGAVKALNRAVREGTARAVDETEIARAHIQLGEMQFLHGRFERARRHYRDAVALWPGGYLPMEHLAEIEAALGNFDVSAALYEQVLDGAPHPDLLEAYADVRRALNDTVGANALVQRAHAAYLASVASGDPSYLSHLVDLTLQSGGSPEQAAAWAEEETNLRATAQTRARLAWAQALARRCTDAKATAAAALASPLPPDIGAQEQLGRALILCGSPKQGQRLLRAVLAYNPRHPDRDALTALLK